MMPLVQWLTELVHRPSFDDRTHDATDPIPAADLLESANEWLLERHQRTTNPVTLGRLLAAVGADRYLKGTRKRTMWVFHPNEMRRRLAAGVDLHTVRPSRARAEEQALEARLVVLEHRVEDLERRLGTDTHV